MKLLTLFLFVWLAAGQDGRHRPPFDSGDKEQDVRLPNGKSQKDEILKADYKKNLEDATELAKLAEELKADIEKDESFVVSVKTLKKTDDIEKLAKRIRGRLKRF
jgi:hypothetical protein